MSKYGKLSDAIVLGSLIIRPVSGMIDDGQGGGCAIGMGMAAHSVKAHYLLGPFEGALCAWPWLRAKAYPYSRNICEAFSPTGSINVGHFIAHLFDFHVVQKNMYFADRHCPKMTFEELVSFIKSVEPAEESFQSPAPIAKVTVGPEGTTVLARA